MSEMNQMLGTEVLLTSKDIRHWQLELQKWEAAETQAKTRVAELRAKLEAAAILFGGDLPAVSLADADQDDENQESMGDAANRLLAAANRAVPHDELKAELRKIPRFREMLDKNKGAYYYTMVARLLARPDTSVKRTGRKLRFIHRYEVPPEGNPGGTS